MRQVVLVTETTGLQPESGDRLIEIAGMELIHRSRTGLHFHSYLNPERPLSPMAQKLHGMGDEFLSRQPRFEDVAAEFLQFVEGAELVLHNAKFDVAFINCELTHLGSAQNISECCQILDTLELARRLHPGQQNSLKALAKRYPINTSVNELPGALRDVAILAEIYLAMSNNRVAV